MGMSEAKVFSKNVFYKKIINRLKKAKNKTLGDHKEFLKRITKSLYYGKLPSLPCLSLPVTEISAELFSEAQRGRSLKRLHVDAAAEVTRGACVSPCSLVLAILYLERLKAYNPDYLAKVAPSELFLVSLMVSNKFLQDDGEEDEVFCDEWATSGRLDMSSLKHLEKDFLNAIDWKVYVSEQSFEAGLSWLERQVALKQANLRGFFTYADLTTAVDSRGLGHLLYSLSSVCLAITLGYVASLLTVVTSTLLISQSLLPTLQSSSSPIAVEVSDMVTTIRAADYVQPPGTNGTANTDIDDTDLMNALCHLEKSFTTQLEMDKVICCSRWSRACTITERQRQAGWEDSVSINSLKPDAIDGWWRRSPFGTWLLHFSLLSPLHKWLDKLDRLSYLIKTDILNLTEGVLQLPSTCKYPVEPYGTFSEEGNKCKHQWLSLGHFSGFVVSASDR